MTKWVLISQLNIQISKAEQGQEVEENDLSASVKRALNYSALQHRLKPCRLNLK